MVKTLREFKEHIARRINKETFYFKYGNSINDVLNYLMKRNMSVVIWGASLGGKKTLSKLKERGIEVKYFVDIDPKKQGKSIDGLIVKNPDSLSPNDIVIVGSVFEKEIVNILKTKGISFIPACGGLLAFNIDGKLFFKNIDMLFEAYSSLEDTESREIFVDMIVYSLDGDITKTKKSIYPQYFHPHVTPEKNDIIIDGGAYTGDTVIEFCKSTNNEVEIFAFEPDKENYKGLKSNLQGFSNVNIYCYGLWSKNTVVPFSMKSNMGSYIVDDNNETDDKTVKIKVVSLDSFFDSTKVKPTLIKLDIEGAELEALKGAKEIIKKYKPKLQICIYHHTEHSWEIPLFIKSLVPEYKMYLGHHTESWGDSVLYCI